MDFLLSRCDVVPLLQSDFQLSGNGTQRQTEFLGVLGDSQVDASMLEEPLQALCQDRSIHWTRKVKGESSFNMNINFYHVKQKKKNWVYSNLRKPHE